MRGITYAECLGDGCDLCAAGFQSYSDREGDDRKLPYGLIPNTADQWESLKFAMEASVASWSTHKVHALKVRELEAVRP